MTRLVVAYSGARDPACLRTLAASAGAEIVALTLDLGQGADLTGIREAALRAGAVRAHVVDAREALVRDYVLPCLQAGAFEVRWPMIADLARLAVASGLVRVAAMEEAVLVAHGSRSAAGQRVFETAAAAITPDLRVVAAAPAAAPAAATPPDRGRSRSTIWGRSVPAAEQFLLTCDPNQCPGDPATVEIRFQHGVPVAVNDVDMTLLELIESLDTVAGAHGVGRTAGRPPGGRCEAPAAAVLREAYAELHRLVLDEASLRLVVDAGRSCVELVETGGWFSGARARVATVIQALAPRLTGAVRLQVLRGECKVLGARALSAAAAPPAAS